MNRFQKLNKVLANINVSRMPGYYNKQEEFLRLYKLWQRQNRKKSLKIIRREIMLRK